MLLPKPVGSMAKTSFLLVKLCSPDFAQTTSINLGNLCDNYREFDSLKPRAADLLSMFIQRERSQVNDVSVEVNCQK